MKQERTYSRLEVKEVADSGQFAGYGSVFNVEDSYKDVIAKGAFKRTLAEHRKSKTMPKLLWQHNWEEPIGIYTSMTEDDHGLRVEGQLLLEVQRAREAHALLKAGALDGLSIGFVTRKAKYDEETQVRTLTDIDLWEVSPVTFPANPAARVQDVRSMAEGIKTIREFEDFLRDVGGFSAREAKAIASQGYKALERDAARDEQALRELCESLRQATQSLNNL